MVQNDIQRSHVLSRLEKGKIKEAGWFQWSLSAFVQGCDPEIFFPCSGNGNGSSWNNRGSNGNYWSASLNSATNGRNLNFNSGGVNPQNNNNRFNGFAGRPVQHTLLTVLFLLLMMYGTDTQATSTGSVSGILRCQASQVAPFIRTEVGSQPETEHGGAVRRFVLQEIPTFTLEVLHCGLSEEAGNLRSNVQGQDSASSLLQLHPRAVREDVYTGLLQLHQGQRHTLWHRQDNGLLQEGESQLAAEMLCDAYRHQRILHAHCAQEASGDCSGHPEEDGYSQNQQAYGRNLGRCAGYGLADLAVGSHHSAGPEGQLYHCGRQVQLGRTRPCQVDAVSGGWAWTAYRQPDKPVVLECLSERVRPVHEAGAEVQVLWQVCGRCRRSIGRQRMAVESCSEDQGVPAQGAGTGSAYGQAGDTGGTSWSGVPGSFHQAIQDLHIQSCPETDREEDRGLRLQEALEGAQECQQLSGNLQAHVIIQPMQETADEEGDTTYRSVQR